MKKKSKQIMYKIVVIAIVVMMVAMSVLTFAMPAIRG